MRYSGVTADPRVRELEKKIIRLPDHHCDKSHLRVHMKACLAEIRCTWLKMRRRRFDKEQRAFDL